MACSYLAGPKFNDDDNRKEQESLTCAERREAQDDIFGVGCRRRVEDDELRAQSLQQLRAAIDDFSDDEKEEYLEARRRNADTTVSDGELLPFLRSANYNPLDAAQRLMAYWRRRISLFGPARAFERLSVGGTLTGDEDDMFANSMNFLSISEVTDEHKRKVLCLHLGTQKTNCKQNSLLRVMWCMCHDALASSNTSKEECRIILVIIRRGALTEDRDRKLEKLLYESLEQHLPISLCAVHDCHPPTDESVVIMFKPVVDHMLGRRLRQRIVRHKGSHEQVVKELLKYGIPKQVLPKGMGRWAPSDSCSAHVRKKARQDDRSQKGITSR